MARTRVIATTEPAGGKVHYEWYAEGEDEYEARTTKGSHTTPELTASTVYTCVVTDDYGNTERVEFHLTVIATRLTLAAGESLTLDPLYDGDVTGQSSNGSAVTVEGTTVTAAENGTGNATVIFQDESGDVVASYRISVAPADSFMKLPGMLTTIESEAFSGIAARFIELSDKVERVKADAFAGSKLE